MRRSGGFTLLEVIVAMTILALIMTGVYMTLSVGTRLWERQSRDSLSPERRLEACIRLLRTDFKALRHYHFTTVRGQANYLGGGPTAFFYITSSGIGAEDRDKHGLYFACVFLAPAEHGLGLWLYKSRWPDPELLNGFLDFSAADQHAKDRYVLGETLRSRAVLLLDGISEGRLGYLMQPLGTNGAAPGLSTGNDLWDNAQDVWTEQMPPAQVALHLQLGDHQEDILATTMVEATW